LADQQKGPQLVQYIQSILTNDGGATQLGEDRTTEASQTAVPNPQQAQYDQQ
jgi:FKBP-type peptidyl-prolyl cis-trans isomerase